MKLPDFLIIGGVKCGTTAMWYNLDKHPKITMATRTKDMVGMNFWGPTRISGKQTLKWYKSRFDGEISGEKSGSYYSRAACMKDIYNHIPNAKLILCVRNPIERGYSEFQMNTKSKKGFTFDIFKKRYARSGKYYMYIQNNVLKFFPKENLHICVMEHLKKDITAGMKSVFDFLGAEDLGYAGKEVPGVLQRARHVDINISREEKFYRIWSKFSSDVDQETRRRSLEYCKEFNEQFFNFIGYRIKEWSK
jgi:hypothetical protein